MVKTPNQPGLRGDGSWDWESEETLVDRRNRLSNRIARLIRSVWLWAALIALFVFALFDAALMQGILFVGSFAIQLLFLAGLIIFQLVVLYSFVARSRMYTILPGAEGVSFADYRGQPELLEQAQQVVTLLRGVKAFEGSGGEPLNGLLLEGPPGTGKTWLAQAISTEAGVPFYYVDTSSLQGTFMGTGAMKVSRMYGKARKAAKDYGAAVIFLDEIDAIGSRSGVSRVGGDDPRDSMMGGNMAGMGLLSTILIEMSGFSLEHGWRARLRTWAYKTFLRRKPPKPQKRILTIGATNRIQSLDPALLRPGRFDKKIRIDAPDMMGRRDIIAYYLSKMAHDDSMDPAVLATETPDYTPADIKYVLNEALRYALFAGRTYITYRDFQLAQPEHEMGLRSPLKHMSEKSKRQLAYHEAGHAVAVRLFLPHHRISRITIIRQGFTFGHVKHYPAREAYENMQTRDEFMNHLRVSVAGKAAEVEFCGVSEQTFRVLGYRNEFERIRNLLRLMAGAGMLGPLGATMGDRQDMVAGTMMTPDMAQAMEETFRRVFEETRIALRQNAPMVHELVKLMYEKQELLSDEVRAFFDQYGLKTPDPTTVRDGQEFSILEAMLPAGAGPGARIAASGD